MIPKRGRTNASTEVVSSCRAPPLTPKRKISILMYGAWVPLRGFAREIKNVQLKKKSETRGEASSATGGLRFWFLDKGLKEDE